VGQVILHDAKYRHAFPVPIEFRIPHIFEHLFLIDQLAQRRYAVERILVELSPL
jgi:hypothetical protein